MLSCVPETGCAGFLTLVLCCLDLTFVLLQAEAAERARAELRGLKDQLAATAAQQEAAAAAMQGGWLLSCSEEGDVQSA
jgi:invasion protein IalB